MKSSPTPVSLLTVLRFVALGGVALGSALGCTPVERAPADAVISIDGELIPSAAFDAYLNENVGGTHRSALTTKR